MKSLTDLDALTTLEDYATYQEEVRSRIRELDNEYAGKPFSDEARAEWADLEEIDRKVEAAMVELRARAERIKRIGTRPSDPPVERIYPTPQVRTSSQSHVPENVFAFDEYRTRSSSEEQLNQAYRDGAMFAVERATYPHPESKPDQDKAHIAGMLDTIDTRDKTLAKRILATGSPGYLRAFNKIIAGAPLTAEEQRYAAGLVQTDAQGGYAVPFYFDPTIVHVGAWTSINPYRQACRVVNIVGTDTYHGVTATAVLATRAAEAAAAVESGPATWAQISAITARVQAMVTVSIEFMQDRADLASEVASLIAEAKDTEEEAIFTTGVGDALGTTYNPIGMFAAHGTSGAFTHVTSAGSQAFAIGDLYTVEAAVPIRHRMNAAWFMGRAEIRAVQAVETSGGQLFGGSQYASVGYPVNSPVGNTGLRLLTYPIYEVPSAPTGTAANAIVMALGDPKAFGIVERVGMQIEVIPHLFGAAQGNLPTGNRGIYAVWRNTAKPFNVDGMRTLAIQA